ncbi:MAG: uroporphyrinogen-III synthase [Candidatus Dormibacteria bacterium]
MRSRFMEADPDPGAGRSLGGRRVLVTRAAEQAGELALALARLGAEVIEAPLISFEAPADSTAARAALASMDQFDLVFFTSGNGVRWSSRLALESGLTIAAVLRPLRVVAVGRSTAGVLEGLGARVDLVPSRSSAEGIAEGLQGEDLRGRPCLLLGAESGHDFLPGWLSGRGARLTQATVYRTVADPGGMGIAISALQAGLDLVALASPSVAEIVAALPGGAQTPCACIGPTTSEAARGLGLEVVAEANEQSAAGLVAAISDYFSHMSAPRP